MGEPPLEFDNSSATHLGSVAFEGYELRRLIVGGAGKMTTAKDRDTVVELERTGSVSWAGSYRPAFLFAGVSITLQHWLERAPDGEECGVRVEIQRLSQSVASESASEFAAKVLRIGGPIWRADIFMLGSASPRNLDRAHYHPHFVGDEPSDRVWDKELKAAPFPWLSSKLRGISEICALAGAPELISRSDCELISRRSQEIVAATEKMMEEVWAAAPHFLEREGSTS